MIVVAHDLLDTLEAVFVGTREVFVILTLTNDFFFLPKPSRPKPFPS